MSARDPRIDPRPGDVVKLAGDDAWIRIVIKIEVDFVMFHSTLGDYFFPRLGSSSYDWQKECFDAEVLHVNSYRP